MPADKTTSLVARAIRGTPSASESIFWFRTYSTPVAFPSLQPRDWYQKEKLGEGVDILQEYLTHYATGEHVHILGCFQRRVDVAMRNV